MTRRGWSAGAAFVVALAGLLVWHSGRERSRLLWYEGRPVKWAGGRGIVLTAEGALFEVRPDSRLRRLQLAAGSRTFLDAAPGADGVIWLSDGEGSLVRRSADGTLTEVGRTPFDLPSLAAAGGALWAARSPVQFTYRPELDTAALALRLDTALHLTARAGVAHVPDNPFLTQLANASQLLPLGDGGVVVAPFVRDEVIRFGPDGSERWRTARGLSYATPNPTMTARRDSTGAMRLVVDYVPVNLGVTEGPDGTIYVLSTVAARTDSSRLDALDPLTGAVQRTWRFDSGVPTLAVNPRGDVSPAGVAVDPPDAREAFATFSLPTPGGDSLRLAALAGRVVVVNFWASWCAPCRDEFPALDSLAGTYDTSRVVFVALSDDITRRGAERFLAEHPVRHMRVGLGGGRLKARYHYIGLPTTTLLDGRGLTVGRWIGFEGPIQVEKVAGAIAAELARAGTAAPAAPAAPAGGHHHHS